MIVLEKTKISDSFFLYINKETMLKELKKYTSGPTAS